LRFRENKTLQNISMDNMKTRLGLTLLGLKGFGKVKAREIIRLSNTLPETTEGIAELLAEVSEKTAKKLPAVNITDISSAMTLANKTIEDCAARDISISFVEPSRDCQWKSRFSRIPNPPLLLFSLGNTEILNGPSIAIIGTRQPTSWGEKSAIRFAEISVEQGFCVVSGLALGCDIAAHKGALQANGSTAAVLAHGLDSVHPRQHSSVAREILENGGCLLSEYPPGVGPERGNFVERDRLQSGASLGVIVIETTIDGGSMHTVRFAEKQKRLVGCIDHPVKFHDLKSVKGNRKLLDDGASAIKDRDDLEQFLKLCSNPGESGDQSALQQADLFL